tara:strand:+ start:1037 stop:1384 length:348 start_codon:yes stop_codon:yes gene_type:complete
MRKIIAITCLSLVAVMFAGSHPARADVQSDIIQAIGERTQTNNNKGRKALKAFVGYLSDKLAKNEKVKIKDFGTFKNDVREERRGRNPRTNEEIVIPAKFTPKFNAAKKLVDAVQ